MALPAFSTSFLPSSIHHNQPSLLFFRHLRSSSAATSSTASSAQFVTCASKIEVQEIETHSANWQPSVWDHDFLQSLSVNYTVTNFFCFFGYKTQPSSSTMENIHIWSSNLEKFPKIFFWSMVLTISVTIYSMMALII